MANAPDFNMKQQVDVVGIANTLQRKQQMEFEAKEQQRARRLQETQQVIQGVSGLVSASIAHSKEKQRADMIQNLAASMAAKVPNVMAPQLGPVMPDQAPLPAVSTPDLVGQNRVRSAVSLSPDTFAKEVAQSMFADTNAKGFAPQQGALEMTNGKIIPAVFKDGKYFYANSDQLIPRELIAGKGFKPSLADDPYSGDKINVSGTGRTTQVTGPAASKPGEKKTEWAQLTPVRRTAVEKAKHDFDSSPTVSAMTTRLQKFDETEALLQTKNWVGDAALGAFIARTVASEVGNLNQQEQEIYRISPEIIRGWKTKASRWTEGKITEADREDIQKVLDVSKAKTLANLDKEADFHTNRLNAKMKDVDRSLIKSSIYEGEYRQPKATNTGGMDLGDGFSFTVR